MIAKAYRSDHAYFMADDPERLRWWVVRHFNCMQSCSCLGCGNARKHSGPTRQERRAGDEGMLYGSDQVG
jgi:hypothetical protein